MAPMLIPRNVNIAKTSGFILKYSSADQSIAGNRVLYSSERLLQRPEIEITKSRGVFWNIMHYGTPKSNDPHSYRKKIRVV